ncbi:MAG: LptF/LptG family permease, partial [Acinetobacter sp.]
SVNIIDPSPATPSVMLHSGTAYTLKHQGIDDSERIYRNLDLNLKPLTQSADDKRKAKSVVALLRSYEPADHAEVQWRESRGVNAFLMALLAIPLSRVKPRQGRFSTLLPLTVLFTVIFYGGNICRSLVASGYLSVNPGVWLVPILMLVGVIVLIARDFGLLQKLFR